jgi:DnaJ like chaperone protein
MLAAGPPGAAIGAFIGHQFDNGTVATGTLLGPPDPLLVNQLFFPTTFRIMGHVAKADGRVSEQEIASARAIMRALRLNEAQVQAAIAFFNEGKQPAFDLDDALRRLRGAIRPYPELAHFFMEMQLQAALAGNGLSELPRARLRRVAGLLGLGPAEFSRLENVLRFRAGAGAGFNSYGAHYTAGGPSGSAQATSAERLAQAYSLLEASATLADEDLVKAYRRQMSRHHPDKLKAHGLPESMLERAKERTQQIQAAYELIRAARGMR